MQGAVADESPAGGIGTMADTLLVFLSYSHDSDEHAARVLALADALCDDGIDVILDRYVHPAPEEGWPHWMERNLDAANFVLMICTETYLRRVLDQEEPGKGTGVRWEGKLIYNRICYDKPAGSRFIPILLPGSEPEHIPNPVQGHAHYRITTFDLTDPGYEAVYRHLTDQPATPKPDLGPTKRLPPKPRPQPSPGPLPPSGGPRTPSIFLSYAHDDDTVPSFIKRLYNDLKEAGLDVCDRADMPSRGLTFNQEIKDAISARDRLLLVMGPRAADSNTSNTVTQEWKHALEKGKVVTPILFSKELSYQNLNAKVAYKCVPKELRGLHCQDFRDLRRYESHLQRLVKILSAAIPVIGTYVWVPDPPIPFLARGKMLRTLRSAVRLGLDSSVAPGPAASRVGLHGTGGVGKSVLAVALAHDRKVRRVFPDGIYWIAVGETVGRWSKTADEGRRRSDHQAGDASGEAGLGAQRQEKHRRFGRSGWDR